MKDELEAEIKAEIKAETKDELKAEIKAGMKEKLAEKDAELFRLKELLIQYNIMEDAGNGLHRAWDFYRSGCYNRLDKVNLYPTKQGLRPLLKCGL